MLQSFLKGWKVAYNVTSEKFIFNQITIALNVFLSIESVEVRNEGLAAKRRQRVGRAGTLVKQGLVQGPEAQTEGVLSQGMWHVGRSHRALSCFLPASSGHLF